MKQNKGITLITLILTVIILLILAGVTIDYVADGKIIDSAEDVVNQTEQQIDNQEQMVEEVRNLYK